MKPLKAQMDELAGGERELAELFAVAPTYRRNPVRKQLVKGMVLAGRRERRRPLGMALAAALFIAGTAAAATLGHQLLTSEEAPIARAPSPPEVHAPRQLAPAPVVARAPEPEQPAQPEAEVSEVAATAPAKPQHKLRTHHVAKRGKAQAPQATPAPGEDPTRVVQAIRALRQQGDAAKAQGLLNDYMKKNPNGLLSEEALALSIEAAHTRKDPKAKSYARRYLARFPGGRHSAFAKRVLAE